VKGEGKVILAKLFLYAIDGRTLIAFVPSHSCRHRAWQVPINSPRHVTEEYNGSAALLFLPFSQELTLQARGRDRNILSSPCILCLLR
jgi:hypothetical protein